MFQATALGVSKRPGWFDGVVQRARTDGRVDILYDDGDAEKNVAARYVKRAATPAVEVTAASQPGRQRQGGSKRAARVEEPEPPRKRGRSAAAEETAGGSSKAPKAATGGVREVERLLRARDGRGGAREYLVRWCGHGAAADSWETEGSSSLCLLAPGLVVEVELGPGWVRESGSGAGTSTRRVDHVYVPSRDSSPRLSCCFAARCSLLVGHDNRYTSRGRCRRRERRSARASARSHRA